MAAIGKIVGSESHVRYTCQVFGPGEVATPPDPAEFAFSSFVRVPLRCSPAPRTMTPASHPEGGPPAHAIGLIYDTILVNPAFGSLGPRLSNDDQLAIFSPDYVTERAVLVSILLLGTVSGDLAAPARVRHGVPPVAPDLGATVELIDDDAFQAFHHFADGASGPGGAEPYLHMGYLPHAIAQDNSLLPVALLRTIERLESLMPQHRALLSIVSRNLAWRMKVQTAG